MSSTISVQDLCIQTDDQQRLVEGVNWEIPEGNCLVLVGESGSGKTLTGLALAELLPTGVYTTRGAVTFNGSGLKRKERQNMRGQAISYVFQNYAATFSPQMTLGRQLHETLTSHLSMSRTEQQEVIAKALEDVGLSYEHIQGRYSFECSGGQLQRVSIAAALMLSPAVIVADEPTTALDSYHSKQVLELLLQAKEQRNCMILLITHDFSIARKYGDLIAVMQAGTIVEFGNKQNVLEQPVHSYTKQLVEAERLLYNEPDPKQDELIDEAETILTVKHLEKKYDEAVPVLKDISFSIKKGEAVGLIGLSGSGKSTLARCLLQLDSFDAEQMTLFSQQQNSRSKNRGKIQAVFQQPGLSLNPLWSIIDSLMEPLDNKKRSYSTKKQYRKSRLQQAKSLMEQVGLASELLDRYPGELSGGQKQRVCIARAISTNPDLLILDEPTSSLDMIVQAQIIQLLKDLQQDHLFSSLIISHNERALVQLADRFLYLEDGVLV